MESYMKDNGLMIRGTEVEKKNGQMEHFLREITTTIRKMEEEDCSGQMVIAMLDNFGKIVKMDKEL